MSPRHYHPGRSIKVVHFSTSALATAMVAMFKPEVVDPFTEHVDVKPSGNILDQATFDPPIPEEEKVLAIVPRRLDGAENTSDA